MKYYDKDIEHLWTTFFFHFHLHLFQSTWLLLGGWLLFEGVLLGGNINGWKIINDEAVVDKTQIQPVPDRQRRRHTQQLQQLQCRTNYRQQSFLPNTICDWNEWPAKAVAAGTLDTFKSRVPITN